MAAIMNLCMKPLGMIPIIPGNSTALHENTSLYLFTKYQTVWNNMTISQQQWLNETSGLRKTFLQVDFCKHFPQNSYICFGKIVLQLKMGNVPMYMWLWPISGNGDKRDSGGANLKRFFWSVRHFLWDALTKRVSNCLGETKLLAHPLLTWIPCPSYTHLTPLMTQRRKSPNFLRIYRVK